MCVAWVLCVHERLCVIAILIFFYIASVESDDFFSCYNVLECQIAWSLHFSTWDYFLNVFFRDEWDQFNFLIASSTVIVLGVWRETRSRTAILKRDDIFLVEVKSCLVISAWWGLRQNLLQCLYYIVLSFTAYDN